MQEWLRTIGRLMAYIDDHAADNPPLSVIAAQVGYSPYHCSEQFHRLTGLTIRTYMAKRRLWLAARALRETDRPIVEIALEAGFSSQTALTRALKRACGCTPAAYRRTPEPYLSAICQEVNTVMEFRRIFDTIPEQFDRWRPRYSPALFADLIAYAGITPRRTVLELGPGTGQATGPILDTGCDYHAIELGENMAAKMIEKYGTRPNFHIVCDDFLTHDYGAARFDLIYSAATIQWMPEAEAFAKTFALLKPGGTLAMMYTRADYRTPNPALYDAIQRVYAAHFCPDLPYTRGKFHYDNAPAYGFVDCERRAYRGTRVLDAEGYVALSGTHCDHLTIPEPHRSLLFDGLRQAVLDAGDRIEFSDTYELVLARKPAEQA